MATSRAFGLAAVSAVAIGAYAIVSRAVARGQTRVRDRELRRSLTQASPRAKLTAEVTGHIGKWYTHVPVATVGAVALVAERRYAAAASVLGSSLGVAALSSILDHAHQHRTPPPGKRRIQPDAQSYPSGHALETTGVVIAAGWVLVREGIAPAAAVVPTAVALALISGLGRLVLDKHWVSDSIGGYLAGVALGTASAAVYELAHGESRTM